MTLPAVMSGELLADLLEERGVSTADAMSSTEAAVAVGLMLRAEGVRVVELESGDRWLLYPGAEA